METLLIADNVTHMVQRGFLAPIDVFALAHVSRRVRALVTSLSCTHPVELVQSAYRDGSLAQIAWLRAQGVRGSETTVWCALLAGRDRYRLLHQLVRHGLLGPGLTMRKVCQERVRAALVAAPDPRLVVLICEDILMPAWLVNEETLRRYAIGHDTDLWYVAFTSLVNAWGGELWELFDKALNTKDWPLAASLWRWRDFADTRLFIELMADCDDLEVARFMLAVDDDASVWEEDADKTVLDCVQRNYLNTVHMVLEMGAYALTPGRHARLVHEGNPTPDMQRLLQNYAHER